MDQIIISQHNMIMDSEVHLSVHSNFHHEIIYTKFDLKVCYPPYCERNTWHFSWANSDHMKKPSAYSIGNCHLITSM